MEQSAITRLKEIYAQIVGSTVAETAKNATTLSIIQKSLIEWLEKYDNLIKLLETASKEEQDLITLIESAKNDISNISDKEAKSVRRSELRHSIKNLTSSIPSYHAQMEKLLKEGVLLLETSREIITNQKIVYITEQAGFKSKQHSENTSSTFTIYESEAILESGALSETSSRSTSYKKILEGSPAEVVSTAQILSIKREVRDNFLHAHAEGVAEAVNILMASEDYQKAYRQSLAVFLNSKTYSTKNNEGKFFEAVIHGANQLLNGNKRISTRAAWRAVDNRPYYSGPDSIVKIKNGTEFEYVFLQAKLLGSASISGSTTYTGIKTLSDYLKDLSKIDEQKLIEFFFGSEKSNKLDKSAETVQNAVEQEAYEIGVKYLKDFLSQMKSLT